MADESIHLLHMAHKLHHAVDHEMKGQLGENVAKTIKQHAITAAGFGLVPVPIVGLIGLVGNTWTMYVRINQEVGLPFGSNLMKSIATAIGTNVISIMPGMLIGKIAAQAAKSLPIFGSAAGMVIDAATNYALVLVMGIIYVVALTKLFARGQDVTEENLKAAAKETSKDKGFIKQVFKAAKEEYKNSPPKPDPEFQPGTPT